MSVISSVPRACPVDRGPGCILGSDGEKGGVGKSFLLQTTACVLTHAGISWTGIDLDPRNGHLLRFHGGEKVKQFDWTEPAEWDRVYDRIMEVEASQIVLIDFPAQAGTALAREYPRLLATAAYTGRPLLRFWSLAPGFDSVNLLTQTLGMVACRNTFAILNLRDSSPKEFDLWLKSKTRRALLEGGGSELLLPRLPSGVAAAIEAEDLSFADALVRLKQPYFRFDLETFLAEVQREFAPLVDRLAR